LHGPHGFDPNQPRVPAGHNDGGRWTDKPGAGAPSSPRRDVTVDRTGKETWNSFANAYRPDGTLAEQRVFNRDGSRIVSEFNEPGSPGDWDVRHTIITKDGRKLTFETAGDVQRTYDENGRLIGASVWTNDGPEALPMVQQAFLPAIAAIPPTVTTTIELGLILFAWLASQNRADRVAVFGFKAREYQEKGTRQEPDAVFVAELTRDEVEKACKQLEDVQKRADAAVAKVRKDGDYEDPADFGTKVHRIIAHGINGENDPNYIAEVSVMKSRMEAAHYGKKDTVRVDVFENRPEISTVCIYDPKTGSRGLSRPRMAELANTAERKFPGTNRIIVIEVRPGQK
jgi:hypothetical protein